MSKSEVRQFQVEVVGAARGHKRALREIEDWLTEWDMSCNILATLSGGKCTIRAAFKEERHARAFELQYGGRRIEDDELLAALAVDAQNEELFEQLAREFPE